MTKATKPIIALFGKVPPEVEYAVIEKANLVTWSDMSDEQASSVTHALTSAMKGANIAMLERFPNLKHISSCGAGLDKFDLEQLNSRGVELHNTGDIMTHDTAEMAVTLMFSLLRRILQNDVHVRSGTWEKERASNSSRIAGKRVGIIGLGQIGITIAKMLEAFGLNIAYHGPNQKPDFQWQYVPELKTLAQDSDVLILSCIANPSTNKMINSKVLSALGEDGYLINVSRGSVIDEDALIDALVYKRIAGAALDVFENEPMPDKRFIALENVILQPHAATLTKENRLDLAAEILSQLSLTN